MKVEAELKEMYKVILGDNGMCMGQYYSEDDWKESYYGETIEDILDQVNGIYYKGLPKTFDMEKWNVLTYKGHIYDYEKISEYNRYIKDSEALKEEVNEFYFKWNNLDKYRNARKNMIESDKLRDERNKKIAEIKAIKEKEKKEMTAYLKLKEKFEK